MVCNGSPVCTGSRSFCSQVLILRASPEKVQRKQQAAPRVTALPGLYASACKQARSKL